MISIIKYRQMSELEQKELDEKIHHHLCWHVTNGWRIGVAENKTSKEMAVSKSIVGKVASTRKFKTFYSQHAVYSFRGFYGLLCQ